MQVIKAKFIGVTGPLGYRTGFDYFLIFKQNSFLEKLFNGGFEVEIWRSRKQPVLNSVSDSGYCPYKSMTTFLMNWDVLEEPQVNIVFGEMHMDNIIPVGRVKRES